MDVKSVEGYLLYFFDFKIHNVLPVAEKSLWWLIVMAYNLDLLNKRFKFFYHVIVLTIDSLMIKI